MKQMSVPAHLKGYLKKGKELVSQGKIGEIAFSGSTYQVQVEQEWAFLQFTENGEIKDCFCSCDSQEEGCVHLAAALLWIYGKERDPLHIRYANSFWRALFRRYFARFGDLPDRIEKKERDHFLLAGAVEIYGKQLQEVLEERREETEETSLKFSSLSEAEIAAWKEGRPGKELEFELSFWSDLAKWILIEERNLSCKIHESDQGLLDKLILQWKGGGMTLPIFAQDLPDLIPLMSDSLIPLKVQRPEIQKIVWDSDEHSLKITSLAKPKNISGPIIDGWIYVSGKGFYSQEETDVFQGELKNEEAARFLDTLSPDDLGKIEGTEVYPETKKLSYHLYFDPYGNLHILSYLFKEGDLFQKSSALFGNWAYLQDVGLVRLKEKEFEAIEATIPNVHVPTFIWERKEWLSSQEGFQTHLTQMETKIEYEVTEASVIFNRIVGAGQALDFGFWVYVPQKGFFPKSKGQDPFPIKHKKILREVEASSFFRKYHEELKLVPRFWAKKCPLAESGLKVALTSNQEIIVSPLYIFSPETASLKHRFFDEFIYVEGKGFYEMPSSLRLPEKYRHPFKVEDQREFFAQEYPAIEEKILEISSELTPFGPFEIVGKCLEQKGEGFFLKIELFSKRGALPLCQIWTQLHQSKRYVFTELGRVDIKDERLVWFSELPKNAMDRRSNALRLTTFELIRLVSLMTIKIEEGKEHLDALLESQSEELPDISGLSSTLRPYQWHGLKWLWFLYGKGLGALLCDEMGLGKTHQAMALIAACKNSNKTGPYLVLCPLSVIFHWQEKLEAFLPGVRVVVYHGSKRELAEEYDILLTSYGTFRNDVAILSGINFTLAVLDEIQAAKNEKSRLHKAVGKLNAQVKIGLTGTPIENRLGELKSLFDLVLPGYMPSEALYKRFFVKPIESEASSERKKLLSRFIKPFVLRRKKADVLQELPDKIEEVEHCQLSEQQRMIYNEALQQRREAILQEMGQGGAPIPFIHIFSLLSSLKQICNHPAAYLKRPKDYKEYSSGKWDLFVELLSEARESGQKVVVFSQYLMMLDIIEAHLRQERVGFAAIRGATRERGKEISRFNNDPGCEVFVGSLQAAGWGIDLTAASVVIHYDRWWNAAREDQATDRVHRFGQTRGVQVFKLVTKGTFEERIDQLISQKGKLMEEVVKPDDHRFLKHFDKQEIFELLKDVEFG